MLPSKIGSAASSKKGSASAVDFLTRLAKRPLLCQGHWKLFQLKVMMGQVSTCTTQEALR
jgi:hypothetical protein